MLIIKYKPKQNYTQVSISTIITKIANRNESLHVTRRRKHIPNKNNKKENRTNIKQNKQ
jgi:hypothetical protein